MPASQPFQVGERAAADHPCASLRSRAPGGSASIKLAAGRCFSMKMARRGAAAQRFDAHGPAAGVGVQERATGDARCQHVEQGLAQAVGRGPQGRCPGRLFRRRLRNSPPMTRIRPPPPGRSGAASGRADRRRRSRNSGSEGGCATKLAASARAISSTSRVPQEVGDAQRGQAGLARAEELARPAQLEIHLRDVEPVVRFHQRPHALAGPLWLSLSVTRMQ